MPDSAGLIVDARAGLLGAAAGLVVAVTAWDVPSVRLAVLCIVPLALLTFAGGSLRAVLCRLTFPAGFLLLAGLAAFLLPWGAEPGARHVRFWYLAFSTLFSVTTAYLLFLISPRDAVMDGLLRLRVPQDMVWTAAIGCRYVPLLREEGRRTTRAASARGWDIKRDATRILGWIACALIVRSFERSLRTARSMDARGYGSPILLAPVPFRAQDWLFLLGYPAAALLICHAG